MNDDSNEIALSREQLNERKAFVERNRYLWVTHITNHTPAADGTFKARVGPSEAWYGGCFSFGQADVDANGDIVRMISQPITMWMCGYSPKPLEMNRNKKE